MRRFLLTAAALCAGAFALASPAQAEAYKAAPYSKAAKAAPLMERFPSVDQASYRVPVYQGKPAADISDKRHGFRTYLRRALKGGPNFGGHYILALPGCGTSCLSPVLVDVKTGRVYDVDIAPFTGFMDPGGQPVFANMDIKYSKDSTLLAFAGSMGEYGTGSFLLNWKGGKFRVIAYSKTVSYEE